MAASLTGTCSPRIEPTHCVAHKPTHNSRPRPADSRQPSTPTRSATTATVSATTRPDTRNPSIFHASGPCGGVAPRHCDCSDTIALPNTAYQAPLATKDATPATNTAHALTSGIVLAPFDQRLEYGQPLPPVLLHLVGVHLVVEPGMLDDHGGLRGSLGVERDVDAGGAVVPVVPSRLRPG